VNGSALATLPNDDEIKHKGLDAALLTVGVSGVGPCPVDLGRDLARVILPQSAGGRRASARRRRGCPSATWAGSAVL
jgi:hypothetical protein